MAGAFSSVAGSRFRPEKEAMRFAGDHACVVYGVHHEQESMGDAALGHGRLRRPFGALRMSRRSILCRGPPAMPARRRNARAKPESAPAQGLCLPPAARVAGIEHHPNGSERSLTGSLNARAGAPSLGVASNQTMALRAARPVDRSQRSN
jgi:hypothetical protein